MLFQTQSKNSEVGRYKTICHEDTNPEKAGLVLPAIRQNKTEN